MKPTEVRAKNYIMCGMYTSTTRIKVLSLSGISDWNINVDDVHVDTTPFHKEDAEEDACLLFNLDLKLYYLLYYLPALDLPDIRLFIYSMLLRKNGYLYNDNTLESLITPITILDTLYTRITLRCTMINGLFL